MLSGTQNAHVVLEAGCGRLGCHTQKLGPGSTAGCEVWELRLSLPHSERKVIHSSTGRECQGARLEAERPSKWGCCPDSRCGLEDRQVLEQGAGEP